MDIDLAGELEGNANAIALDRCDTNDTKWCLGIPDDDFFTFATCDDEQWSDLLP